MLSKIIFKLHDGASLDLGWGRKCRFRVLLELGEGRSIRVDGKDHAHSTVAFGREVRLLAVEESWLITVDHKVEWLELGNIALVHVLEVGVNGGAGEFLARFVERRLGQGVVHGPEIKVDFLPDGDFREVWGIKHQCRAIVEAHCNRCDCASCCARRRCGGSRCDGS